MTEIEREFKRVYLVNKNESLSVKAPSGKEYDLVWDNEGNELLVFEEASKDEEQV